MARLRFTKMHGIGNDYVYVDCFAVPVADPASLARRVSPRHTAIGSDGLILICPSRVADCRMEMYNADGSRGEMCGNGIRCVGKYVYDHGLVPKETLSVETDAGIKVLQLKAVAGRAQAVTVDMGEPILEGRQIPVNADGKIIEYQLEVSGRSAKITAVSMGNPHAVAFVNEDTIWKLDDHDFARLGRSFENHPFFPKRVNTEFILPISRTHLKMRVWERGSGETLACGTGACAALVAAVLTGRADRKATVELRGGNLEIEWRENGDRANHVFMTGEAVEVFRGEVELGANELVEV